MFKIIGIAALAVVAALVVDFGARGATTPTAHAETTDVVVVGCEFIAGSVDGFKNDFLTDADVKAACGGDATGSNAAGFGTALPATAAFGVPSIANLAKALGDEDGTLEASDFRGAFDENWDNNQISTDCHFGGGRDLLDFFFGMACTLDVFVFVDDEGPTKIDLPSGLATIENTNLDFTCTTDAGFGAPATFVDGTAITGASFATPIVITVGATTGLANGNVVTIAGVFSNFAANGQWSVANVTAATFELVGSIGNGADTAGGTVTLDIRSVPDIRYDNDCADGTVPALGTDNNGDGVVLFHVLVDSVGAGAVKAVSVEQEAVAQDFDINVVGRASNVELTLGESLIETNGNTANVTDCITNTPVTDGIAPPTSTVARAVATDLDGTELTRVPVFFKVTPPADTDIARIGIGNAVEGVTSNTFFSLDPTTPASAPNAAYTVICGGKETGTATIDAAINLISCTLTGCSVLSSQDHSSKDVTVGGVPNAIALTATPAQILCDGLQTLSISAQVTDADGAPVADGILVHFDVFLVGIVTPMDALTSGGAASTTFRGLSSYTVGVPVVVKAESAEASILVRCNGFDTDGDGLPNTFEAANFCLSAQIADSDKDPDFDGLTSLVEYDRATSPCVADTDADGYTDGAEVALGENPLAYCPIMRADVDGDHAVTILDMTVLAVHFLEQVTPATARYNQDADNAITILDLTMMANLFLENVSDCP